MGDSINNLFYVNGYKLDKMQIKAILCPKKAILVLAGAGSGKSLTMIGKIRYLIEKEKINKNEILCLTFTKKAAKNLEDNINNNYKYGMKIYTFHSFSYSLIKDFYSLDTSNMLEYIVDEYFYSYLFLENNQIDNLKILLCRNNLKKLYNDKEFLLLKRDIITFINLFKTSGYNIGDFLIFKENKPFMSLVIDIYFLYESELKSINKIDYNDMIIKATNYIKNNNIEKYKYIIVDEYQDTSYIRYKLLKTIIDKTNSKIICVGDDYQSIYRFNGCNINMFINFKKYFKNSMIVKINNTYRNSQELINAASKFIMKNNKQLYKKLKSKKRLNKPIKIVYNSHLSYILDIVIDKFDTILVLGRNNIDIEKYYNIDNNNFFIYKNKKIKYLTVHSSKGLEADVVILINLTNNITGFPTKIKDSFYIKYFYNSNVYPFDEERRLFYVALTRTKNEVYLLCESKNISLFVLELIKDNKKYIEIL